MPPDWKTYLRTPRCLLTQREADRNTIREYEFLYHHRAPIRLLDESELPTQGLAEQSVLHWLRESDRDCALLLGDFGDGKSFFTYTLARRMTEEFLRSPGSGWIPLRLSLRGLGDHPVDSRTFLDQRLLEFCAGVRTWNEITQRYRFLVILDGLDEMSLGMNDTAVLHNLNLLEQLLEQFQGHRILVTSRKKVIYADKVHERLLTVLQQPEVWHLAPLSRTDRLAFLDRLANTKEQKARLIKIQQTHDLMGLAAKPLFLDMLRVQLDNDHIHELDMSGFYRTYAEQVLARKQHFQLALAGDHTSPGEIRRRMLILLEEMALCMQRMETDSLSLTRTTWLPSSGTAQIPAKPKPSPKMQMPASPTARF